MTEFKPAWWLPGPHLQTLWPHIFRKKIKNMIVERERFELPDGDFLDLDWVNKNQQGPIVVVLHGLEGSIHSPYIQGIMNMIQQCQWRGVLMHFRGCSGEPNRLAKSYHSGDTQDVATVLKALSDREPHTAFAAIGFSLGGNVLLKWLGESGDKNPLSAAVAISVPFELEKCSTRIRCGFSRVYERHLLNSLCRKVMHKFRLQLSPIALPKLSRLRSMREFDEAITAPLNGFASAQEYYSLSSSRQYLQMIKVPTLVLHAKDDPFMTEDAIPDQHELSPYIELEVTKKGGHVGFVTGKYPWRAQYWQELRIPKFFLKQPGFGH